MDGEGSLCTDPPPLSKNRRRSPSPIFTEGRGGLYTGYGEGCKHHVFSREL